MSTAIDVRPSRIVINDSVWRIRPSLIEIAPDRHIDVRDFEVAATTSLSKSTALCRRIPPIIFVWSCRVSTSTMCLRHSISGAAMFGGIATGKYS